MPLVALFGSSNQASVKAILTCSRFIAGNEEDGISFGVEDEGDAPDSAVGIETELLHVGVLRSLQSVGERTAQKWSEGFEELNLSSEVAFDLLRKCTKLRNKIIVEFDFLSSIHRMLSKFYVFNCLFCRKG